MPLKPACFKTGSSFSGEAGNCPKEPPQVVHVDQGKKWVQICVGLKCITDGAVEIREPSRDCTDRHLMGRAGVFLGKLLGACRVLCVCMCGSCSMVQ